MTDNYNDKRFEEINKLRISIDNFDSALIHLLAERYRVTRQVGIIKKENDLPPSSPNREAEQAKRWRSLAEQSGLDPDFAERLLNFSVSDVIQNHKELRK